jgi:hypothetical protein
MACPARVAGVESAAVSIVSAILIAAPLTFVAGWLACKAILQLGSTHAPAAIPAPATTREFDPSATLQRPDGRELLAQALEQSADHDAQAQTRIADTELQRELTALREALAERDHAISELKAQVRDLPDLEQLPGLRRPDDITTELTAELEALKHENLLMNGRLHRAEADADKHLRHMVSWRERAKPLIKQCRQQRRIINELRDQFRASMWKSRPTICRRCAGLVLRWKNASTARASIAIGRLPR